MTKAMDESKAPTKVDGDGEEGQEGGKNKKKDNCGTDPVDAISGVVYYNLLDFFYPGPIPLRWERSWSSGNTDNIGLFGYGSSCEYSTRILVESDRVVFIDVDGAKTPFDALVPGEKAFKRSEKMILSYNGEKYTIFNIDSRLRYVFEPKADSDIFRLKQIETETGKNSIDLEYDPSGLLCGLTDSVGRKFVIRNNKTGQIIDVRLNGKTLVKYEYDDNLNLVKVSNVNGDTSSLYYENHLLIKRVSLGGSIFQWEYVGEDSSAKCVHAWGENGLLEYWLDYNDGNTVITNSLVPCIILNYTITG